MRHFRSKEPEGDRITTAADQGRPRTFQDVERRRKDRSEENKPKKKTQGDSARQTPATTVVRVETEGNKQRHKKKTIRQRRGPHTTVQKTFRHKLGSRKRVARVCVSGC